MRAARRARRWRWRRAAPSRSSTPAPRARAAGTIGSPHAGGCHRRRAATAASTQGASGATPAFNASEDRPHGGNVVVLSNGFNISPLAWVVRTRVAPASVTRAIEETFRKVSGGLPVASVRTMDDVMIQSMARSTFDMWLLTIFAVAALLLAAIGIYGLMAYSVQQRTQEIGIRLALGADAPRVRNMVVSSGMSVALAGVAVGLLAAFGLTR